MISTTPDILMNALAIRGAGVSIVPIDHQTKRPLNRLLPRDDNRKPVWKPFQTAIADEAIVRAWFSGGAESFAVVGGAVSGGLLILDFDVARLYQQWQVDVGDLAEGLPVQRTGGGGYQVFCRCSSPGENAKLAWVECETEESGREIAIETRGEGGYAVVPPSLHPDGTRYEMISGELAEIPMIAQARADALIAAARKLDEAPFTRQEKERIERDAVAAHQRRTAASRNGSANVIGQFNEAHPIDALLESHGYTRLGDRFVRPGGKSPSVSVKDGRSVHFSSNDPLNDGKVKSDIGIHDAFDVFAHFKHGGDVKAAVKSAANLLGIATSAPSGAAASEKVWTPHPNNIIEFPEPMRLAEHYLAARRMHADGLTLRRYREEWWVFDHGGYRPSPEEVAIADIYQHVDQLWTHVRDNSGEVTGEYRRIIARSATVNEIAKAIPACGAIVDGDMPQWLDHRISPRPADVVAFRNGLLDTEAWCKGDAPLLPLTPKWFGGLACPYDFDPEATCPNWLAFLGQVFSDDQASIALLQEWFGLNLIPDNRHEKLMLAVGPPRSGKGTTLEMLGAMLGEGQTATTSFTKLSSRFGLAPLVGKLASILPDAHIGSSTDAKEPCKINSAV